MNRSEIEAAQAQEALLPQGFEDLAEFIPGWLGETAQARWNLRASKTMPEIRYFYDRMLERADAILSYLEPFPLDALPGPELRLFQLQLALAQAAMSVELHKQPRAINSPWPHKVRILQGPAPVN